LIGDTCDTSFECLTRFCDRTCQEHQEKGKALGAVAVVLIIVSAVLVVICCWQSWKCWTENQSGVRRTPLQTRKKYEIKEPLISVKKGGKDQSFESRE